MIGQYAQRFYLKQQVKANLTETVRAWRDYFPRYLPLPHPSPRNLFWFKHNTWFENEILPVLRDRVRNLLI